MNISDEAVEAAARALWEHGEMPDTEWHHLDRVSKRVSLDEARAALEAAVPGIMAQVWDQAYEIGADDVTMKRYGLMRGNPYRKARK